MYFFKAFFKSLRLESESEVGGKNVKVRFSQ